MFKTDRVVIRKGVIVAYRSLVTAGKAGIKDKMPIHVADVEEMTQEFLKKTGGDGIVGNEEVATPRRLTKTSNSKGITHPESRSSGQDQCNGSSSLPPVSEIKNASRSQRIQLSSESGSSTLEDGGQDEQGMASTGYEVGIRKSH